MIATGTQASPLKSFAAFYALKGTIRRVFLEAETEDEAREICFRWGAGLEGLAVRPEAKQEPLPVAYDEKTARKLLGGISQATLYRWLATGKVERVPDTRRVLITRSSIERQSQR